MNKALKSRDRMKWDELAAEVNPIKDLQKCRHKQIESEPSFTLFELPQWFASLMEEHRERNNKTLIDEVRSHS